MLASGGGESTEPIVIPHPHQKLTVTITSKHSQQLATVPRCVSAARMRAWTLREFRLTDYTLLALHVHKRVHRSRSPCRCLTRSTLGARHNPLTTRPLLSG